ncbi:MAG: VPLPA-CTERM sorting domain-containing protein [Proteobacteria bacterium]|nr:VPLPA-CTERM sorting domain-containing protein [Pseudomonadota bacterium]
MNAIRLKFCMVIVVVVFFLSWSPEAYSAYYEDTVTFNPSNIYNMFAEWEHTIPSDFDPISATVTLNIKVNNFSQQGTLHLFASNTDTFDYGNLYAAPSKAGYIANLWGDVSYNVWEEVSYDLDAGQLGWLSDDGNIHLALIGPGYYMTDFNAQFWLDSVTLTATNAAVPIPGAVWLLGSGLVGLVGIRRKLKN